jgi:hypothetical protein
MLVEDKIRCDRHYKIPEWKPFGPLSTYHLLFLPVGVATLAEQIVAAAWTGMVAGGGGRTNGGGDIDAPPSAAVPPLVVQASMDPNVVQNAQTGTLC